MECYMYQADLWCVACGEKIKSQLLREGKYPDDPDDESSYDSDEFPKWFMECGEADSPRHCSSWERCVNVHRLSDGTRVGCWLENELTPDGVEYVREAIRTGGALAEFWLECYRDWYPALQKVDDGDDDDEDEDDDDFDYDDDDMVYISKGE